jgi:hypothetical protein
MKRRFPDTRHWLDRQRYAYPFWIAVCLLLWQVLWPGPR